MSGDLGARLQRAGLITREQLAETLASAPLHGSAFVRALLRRGIAEDALVGYFVAEGFGPLIGPTDLAAASPELVGRIPTSVLREFAVLPVRRDGDSWVVAMVAPTERHVVAELERMAGARILPAVARWSDLRVALADVGASQTPEPDDEPVAPPGPPSEPPVIELVQRRSQVPPDSGYRPAPPRESTPDVKLALDPDDAVPLVRHKPVTHVSSAPPPAKVIAKSFAAPREGQRARGLWARPRQDTTPIDLDVSPAPASSPGTIEAAPTELEAATRSAVESLPGTLEAPTEAPVQGETSREDAEPYAKRAITQMPSAAPRARPRVPTLAPPPLAAPIASSSPVAPEHEPALHEAAEAVVRLSAAPPNPTPEERWDIPPAGPRAAAAPARTNKLAGRSSRDLVPMKTPLGEIRGTLVTIRQATDRDEVVRLALDGALSVSRSAVFFALRKGVLKGWDGIGSGVSEDSARNLWIPTSTPSLFQKVVESGVGYFGPYGAAIADGLFRAAVGSRGGDLALLPIKVSGKVVGLLAADDVRGGPQGQRRLEQLVTAVDEAFARIIVKQKQG
ncbi:MAG: hypothetical protein K1X94_35790 [Sandaracinaceae bacterium]|nr:hypothetical protein [Sandaracinaceae bacterium]